jgi:hypothetical protein
VTTSTCSGGTSGTRRSIFYPDPPFKSNANYNLLFKEHGALRQEAAQELFDRIDVHGPDVVVLHPLPNENAWLLRMRPCVTAR